MNVVLIVQIARFNIEKAHFFQNEIDLSFLKNEP